VFDQQGELKIVTKTNKEIWTAGIGDGMCNGYRASTFVVQDDGNLVAYDKTYPVWASDTDKFTKRLGRMGTKYCK